MTPKATSNSFENTSKRHQKTGLGPGGAQGLIFDRFLMILGSIFECIFDDFRVDFGVILESFFNVFLCWNPLVSWWRCYGIALVLL